MNMSYDSANLTTPDIKWLGILPTDLDRFNIPEQCRLPMTEDDVKTGKKMVQPLSRRFSHDFDPTEGLQTECNEPPCSHALTSCFRLLH